MGGKLKKLIIKTGIILTSLIVVSFLAAMILGVHDGRGIIQIVPNPTAKSGSVLPVAAIVFGAALVIALLYGVATRLLHWLSRARDSRIKERRSEK